ncbi:MAG: hypothetical protein ABI824_15385, partial [Acidobacteriota bacterium]
MAERSGGLRERPFARGETVLIFRLPDLASSLVVVSLILRFIGRGTESVPGGAHALTVDSSVEVGDFL